MVAQRRQRERAATRGRILDAALELAREEGWPAVTMRKIGARIDYTHAALYAYFATKDELLLALFREGTEQLVASLAAAREAAPSPEAAVFAVAEAYWAFARAQPELYQVLNGLGGVSLAEEQTMADGARVGAVVRDLLAALPGGLADDADDRVALIWATVHGVVSLAMAGRFSREQARRLIARAAREALLAWRSPPDAA